MSNMKLMNLGLGPCYQGYRKTAPIIVVLTGWHDSVTQLQTSELVASNQYRQVLYFTFLFLFLKHISGYGEQSNKFAGFQTSLKDVSETHLYLR